MTHAPTNRAEFDQRYAENQRMWGVGLDVTLSAPCPFCAAKDFVICRVMDVRAAMMSKGTRCAECGRGAYAIFHGEPGGVQFELVQTVGDDIPDWLGASIRRDDAETHLPTPNQYVEPADDRASACQMTDILTTMVCTRPTAHDGDHIAHGSDHEMLFAWPRQAGDYVACAKLLTAAAWPGELCSYPAGHQCPCGRVLDESGQTDPSRVH